MEKKSFLEDIGKAFVPKRFRPGLRMYLAKAGINYVPYKFFGILFYVAIALTAAIYFLTNFYNLVADSPPLLVGLYVFLFWFVSSFVLSSVIIAGVYFYLNLQIYNRVKIIEFHLQDYLVLVSTNLKGGLSFDKSLWVSIKPEFGILSEEMGLVSKKVMTGTDLKDAMRELALKYDSPTMKRTMDILMGQLESGGEIADVLDQIIDNLRKTKIIKEEMVANTLLFTIFITAIVVVISPLLFALAFNLLSILISVSAQIAPAMDQASTATIPFKLEEIQVDKDEFRAFSVLAISIIALFSSMILSIIQRGDILGGLKYMPFFIAASVGFYFLFMAVLSGVFSFF